MKIDVLKEAREFLISHLMDRACEYETMHPWRKEGKYIILHTFRVYSYAERILETEKDRLSDDEMLIVRAACILHDIGKYYMSKGHAQKSAEIVDVWLRKNPDISDEIIDKERLLKIIAGHSDKNEPEEDLCGAILKDADILDEIGILSIFMTSSWLDRESPYFFNELRDRIQTFELAYCFRHMNMLNTLSAKKIMQEKIDFMKGFLQQLDSELDGTEELYRTWVNKDMVKQG